MPQMLPAMPMTSPWEFPAALNAAPMAGLPMVQFTPADQQPCAYTMACGWGEPMQMLQEPIPPWASAQSMPLSQPAIPQMPALMQPTDSMVGTAEVQMGQSLMWQPSVPSVPESFPQRPLPGTPRSSQHKLEDPCTPLMPSRAGTATSPVMPSPSWLRTPSPDHAHYNIAHFRPADAQQAPAEVDPWNAATLMVAQQSYFAESDGYLSVAVGSPVRAMLEN